jgi:hypothetical protein
MRRKDMISRIAVAGIAIVIGIVIVSGVSAGETDLIASTGCGR